MSTDATRLELGTRKLDIESRLLELDGALKTRLLLKGPSMRWKQLPASGSMVRGFVAGTSTDPKSGYLRRFANLHDISKLNKYRPKGAPDYGSGKPVVIL